MPDTKFGFLPTVVGSMPQTDPSEACSQVVRYLKDIPAWPQLPKRSFLENMYAQFSEGFPGIVIAGDKIHVDRSQDIDKPLERLYTAYLENDFEKFSISPDYGAGLAAFLELGISPRAVKGQVTGPVTWGLTIADNEGKAIIWDDTLSDAAAKMLRLRAAWQESVLKRVSPLTIIFVDEPYMQSYGSSALVGLSREKVISLLQEVFGGISGIKGVHCCGNTDWSVLMDTDVDVINFDAYYYAESLSLYPSEVKRFLDRGGAIAWGIVPNDEECLKGETVASLKDRLEEAMAPFTRNGIPFRQLIEQGLLTPSDGFALLSVEVTGRALELLTELSQTMRKKYL
ncbi:MAG: methionine synthase [Dehalococcoidales bacterium]